MIPAACSQQALQKERLTGKELTYMIYRKLDILKRISPTNRRLTFAETEHLVQSNHQYYICRFLYVKLQNQIEKFSYPRSPPNYFTSSIYSYVQSIFGLGFIFLRGVDVSASYYCIGEFMVYTVKDAILYKCWIFSI